MITIHYQVIHQGKGPIITEVFPNELAFEQWQRINTKLGIKVHIVSIERAGVAVGRYLGF